jgi:hypothetical protein
MDGEMQQGMHGKTQQQYALHMGLRTPADTLEAAEGPGLSPLEARRFEDLATFFFGALACAKMSSSEPGVSSWS